MKTRRWRRTREKEEKGDNDEDGGYQESENKRARMRIGRRYEEE
jgi:hypothetical protein